MFAEGHLSARCTNQGVTVDNAAQLYFEPLCLLLLLRRRRRLLLFRCTPLHDRPTTDDLLQFALHHPSSRRRRTLPPRSLVAIIRHFFLLARLAISILPSVLPFHLSTSSSFPCAAALFLCPLQGSTTKSLQRKCCARLKMFPRLPFRKVTHM